jgi:hypothetical protein
MTSLNCVKEQHVKIDTTSDHNEEQRRGGKIQKKIKFSNGKECLHLNKFITLLESVKQL